MGLLFGGGTQAEKTPAIANIQLQTSGYGQPVPIVYGTARLSGVLVWYNDFQQHEQQKKQAAKGGDVETTEYTYTAALIIALCEGEIAGITTVWADKKVFRDPTTATDPLGYAGAGFTAVNLGARTNPTPWTYLTTNHPTEAVSYAGTAYVASESLDLPNAAPMNYGFAVQGLVATYAVNFNNAEFFAASQTAYDAHPADIVADFLGNPDYGFGWDTSILEMAVGTDGLATSSWTNYCHALGFYLSFAMTEQRGGLDWLQDILDATNSACVWSQGKLKFLPYGDTAATGNSFTYTPNNEPVYGLTTNDFIPGGDGQPIIVTRSNLQDCFNSIPIEYLDRTHGYRAIVAEDPDQADVEAFGLRRAQPVSAHMICRADSALALSRLIAQRNLWVRNTYEFTLPVKYILLEPMDLVTLTDEKLGLDETVVRIKSIKENDDGSFAVEAEEWPFGIGTHTLYSAQTGDGTAVNYTAPPGDANAPLFFVPTLQLTGGKLQIWMATSSANAQWGGAEVWVSDDNASFSYAGNTFAARYGVLTNSPTNSGTTINVNLTVSAAALDSTTAQGATDNLTAMWVGGEVFSYETATLTSAYHYSLTNCLRGRESTNPAAHTTGDSVVRLDDGVFKLDIPYARLGTTGYVKLLSFNRTGGGKQSLVDVSSYSFAIPAAPDILPKPSTVTLAISSTPAP